MRRIYILGGAALVSGLLVKVSYAMRELMALVVLFSVGFGALLLLLVFCFLLLRSAAGIVFWVRMRSPLWNRAISGALRQTNSSTSPLATTGNTGSVLGYPATADLGLGIKEAQLLPAGLGQTSP
jgi:hypothetical protein